MISRKLKLVNVVKEKVLSTVSLVFSDLLLLTITKVNNEDGQGLQIEIVS